MTRQELMDSIKHLKWKRNENNQLRCEMGNCPIVACAHIKGILTGPHNSQDNYKWALIAEKLGLSYREALDIVADADTKIVLELEEVV